MFRVEDLEKLIDECNLVLDEERETIFFQEPKSLNQTEKPNICQIGNLKNIKHIRTMAYALRNSLYYAKENE